MMKIDKNKAILGGVMVVVFYVVQNILSLATSLLGYPFMGLGIVYTIIRTLLDIVTIAASFAGAYMLLAKFLLKNTTVQKNDLIEMGVVVGLVSEAFYRFLAMLGIYSGISMLFCLAAVFVGVYFLEPQEIAE